MNQKKKGLALNLHEVNKTFTDNTVIKNVNIQVASGEFVAIVGKSGCGKSTLLRLISGFEEISSGDIFYDGKSQFEQSQVRFMFQEPRLLPWKSVIENVAIGLPATKNEHTHHMLDAVGLASRFSEWPRVLSGGQKQRVALARALAASPQLLLLDEPLGALDALTRIEMQRLIEHLWKENGFTAILVTHDVSEAVTLADRVIYLADGEVALDIKITIPRPRHRDSDFAWFEQHILDHILGKIAKSEKVEDFSI